MNTRIALYDNIKYFLVLLMVTGHLMEGYVGASAVYKGLFLFIYSFHMPVMIFISGLFYKDTTVKKNAVFYFLIGVFSKLSFLAEDILLGNETKGFSLFTTSGLPWFMFALCAFYLLSWLFRNTDKRLLLITAVMCAMFSGFDKSVQDYLVISRIIVYFPFFLFGRCLGTEGIVKLRQLKPVRVISAAWFLAWLCLCLFRTDCFYPLRHLFTGRNPFQEAYYPYGPLLRMLCNIIAGGCGIALLTNIPDKTIPLISAHGKKTLNVYFWSMIIQKAVLNGRDFFQQIMTSRFGLPAAFAIGLIIVEVCCCGMLDYPMKWIRKGIRN